MTTKKSVQETIIKGLRKAMPSFVKTRVRDFMKKQMFPEAEWDPGFKSDLLIKEHRVNRMWATREKVLENVRSMVNEHRTVLVGPWFSEVGFEILYWIPFINRIKKEFSIDQDRITVISRGGVECWYREIAGRYIDIFDYLSSEEFRIRNEKRTEGGRKQKQYGITDLDLEILALAGFSIKKKTMAWIHPGIMFKTLNPYWALGMTGLAHLGVEMPLDRDLEFVKFPTVDYDDLFERLPENYIAVKFYYSMAFPENDSNKAFVDNVVQRLTETTHVVVLDTGISLDDHADVGIVSSGRIHSLKHLTNPRNNLDIQTRIISRARAFVGTYGGFAYLAPYYGVRSVSFYSHWHNPNHLFLAFQAFQRLCPGHFTALSVDEVGLMRLV